MGCTSSDQNAVVEPAAKYSPKERVPTPRSKVTRRVSASTTASTRKLSNATSVSSAPSGFRAIPSRNDSASYGPAQFASPYSLSPRAPLSISPVYDPYGYPADAHAQQQPQTVYANAPMYSFPYSQYPPAPVASHVESFGQGDVSCAAPDPITLPASVSVTQQASRSNTAGFFGSGGSVFSSSPSAPGFAQQPSDQQHSPSSKRKKLSRSQSGKAIVSPRRPERVQARWKERRMRLASASGLGVEQSDDEVAHGAMRRNSGSTSRSKIVAALDVLKVPQDSAEAQFYAAQYPKSTLTTANAESSDVSD